MKTYYELMNIDSANGVGLYETKNEALSTVRDAYDRYGLPGVEGLALSEKSDGNEGVLLGDGAALLHLATDAALSRATG